MEPSEDLAAQLVAASQSALARIREEQPTNGREVLQVARAAMGQEGQRAVVGAALLRLITLAAADERKEAAETSLSAAVELLGTLQGSFNLLWSSVFLLRPFAYTGQVEHEALVRSPELSLGTTEAVVEVLTRAVRASPEAEAACRLWTEELGRLLVGLGMVLRDRGLALTGPEAPEVVARYCARIASLPEEWREHAIANMTYRLEIDLRCEPKKARRSMDRPMVDHYLRLWSFLPHHGQTLFTMSDPETHAWARERLAEIRETGDQVAEVLRERVRAEQHRLAGAWPETNGN